MKKILAAAILVTTGICASATYAQTVDFPIGQKNGSFNCVVSDPAALVTINTVSLNLNGGCPGSPYVTRPGHLANVPADVLSKNYFQIQKSIAKSGKVEVTVSRGTIICQLGHGDKTLSYGNGQYCSVQPE